MNFDMNDLIGKSFANINIIYEKMKKVMYNIFINKLVFYNRHHVHLSLYKTTNLYMYLAM